MKIRKCKLEGDSRESCRELFLVAGWDIKTTNSFSRFLAELDATPASKIFIDSMIKFKEMYPPLRTGPRQVDYLGLLRGENEYRAMKRAQFYLNKKDLVKVSGGLGGKRLVLTTRAHRIFYEDYPLAKLRREKWNGLWTIVMYDLPEKEKSFREYLRLKLKGLGFGSPQESVLISPLPIAAPTQALIEGEQAERYVWVVSAQRVLGLDNREVAERAWKLDELNMLYKCLLKVSPVVKGKNDKSLLDAWRRCFLALDNVDPYLPLELLPKDWQGENCRKVAESSGFAGLIKSIFQ
ncbi:MAG: PaaX family transcriptional regulator C-terminal domain-containing protein [Patescibacteria group bacterium]